ncbi:hypothetical protein HMPREF9555_01723 [Selenomonas artemidis F0399]|uniref:Uncharacterized protein n=1 Tax=Selenomonas artemidis F0399 TaxID=749551 RepID=E7N3Y3_9FIRM|nr:hypothetical protein HMPREF9555_01723 [Selenomonas artemidis F0399]
MLSSWIVFIIPRDVWKYNVNRIRFLVLGNNFYVIFKRRCSRLFYMNKCFSNHKK